MAEYNPNDLATVKAKADKPKENVIQEDLLQKYIDNKKVIETVHKNRRKWGLSR